MLCVLGRNEVMDEFFVCVIVVDDYLLFVFGML